MTDQDRVGQLLRVVASATAETAWRLDALLDLTRVEDPCVAPVLLGVLANPAEPRSMRLAVLRHLREKNAAKRVDVADVLRTVASDSAPEEVELRVQAVLALGDSADVNGVVAALGAICSDSADHFDVRYAAFTSLQRAGPTPECVALLRQLSDDETLGQSARSILVGWRLA